MPGPPRSSWTTTHRDAWTRQTRRRRVTGKTVGIVPVHLYGGAADLDGLHSLAHDRGLWMIEDCCQAHGALHGSRKVGSIGRAGCFSFYPSKNLTVFGDGGMVTTDDPRIADRVRLLRDHGRSDKYTHVEVGYNLRFNDMQAAVGRRQLALLEDFIAKRRAVASRYDAAFSRIAGLTLPGERPGTRMVYHLYPVRCRDAATRARCAKASRPAASRQASTTRSRATSSRRWPRAALLRSCPKRKPSHARRSRSRCSRRCRTRTSRP